MNTDKNRYLLTKARSFFDLSSLKINENGKTISLLSLALPSLLQSVFVLLLGTVNTLMLSDFSDNAVGATNSANQIVNTVNTVLNMTVLGTTVTVSLELGRGRQKHAARITGTALILTAVTSVIAGIILFICAKPLLVIMNLSGEALLQGAEYLKIRGGLIIQSTIGTFFGTMLICNGHSMHTMIKGIIGNSANVIFGYLFLYVKLIPGLSIVSAVAYASIIAGIIDTAYAVIVFIRLRCPFKPCFDKNHLKKIYFTGVPGGASGLSYMLAQTITTGFMGSIGINALNAKSYISTIVHYTYLVSSAVGTGTKILMGRYGGRGEIETMKKLCRTSLGLALIANISFSVIVFAFHKPLLSIFTENEEILAMAAVIFLADIAVEAARAVNQVLESSLNACRDSYTTLLASTLSCWIGSVLFSYIFAIALDMGLFGCWIAFAIDEVIKAAIYLVRWRSGKWKNKI